MQIFLDCDGVLADFDSYAAQLLGMPPREYEAQKYKNPDLWNILYSHEDFFFNLPKMPDADELVAGIEALGFAPIILTGVPSHEGSDWAIGQKTRWAEKYFPHLSIICCKSKNKFEHMIPEKSNVLIDDWNRHMKKWQSEGGYFILHKTAEQSLAELREVMRDEAYWN